MDMQPSQPPRTPPKAVSPIIIDLLTPSPPSTPLPPSTPQNQTVLKSPSATYSAPSTSNRTPWWLSTTPDSQSTGDLQNRSSSQKNIPAFTPAQQEYITRLSRQGLTLNKIQEGFDAQFPGNQKEMWEISRIRTAAITIKKGKAVWDVEDGSKLSRRIAKQAEARKRTKARKEEFAAVASGERPFFKLSNDASLMKKEVDRDIVTSEYASKVRNTVEDSPLSKRGQQDRDMPDRESPTRGRETRDGLRLKGLLAEVMAGSDEEDDDEQEIMAYEGNKGEGGVLIPPKASLDIIPIQSRTLTAIPHRGRSPTSYPRRAQHYIGVEIGARLEMEIDIEAIGDAGTLNSKLDGHRRMTR